MKRGTALGRVRAAAAGVADAAAGVVSAARFGADLVRRRRASVGPGVATGDVRLRPAPAPEAVARCESIRRRHKEALDAMRSGRVNVPLAVVTGAAGARAAADRVRDAAEASLEDVEAYDEAVRGLEQALVETLTAGGDVHRRGEDALRSVFPVSVAMSAVARDGGGA